MQSGMLNVIAAALVWGGMFSQASAASPATEVQDSGASARNSECPVQDKKDPGPQPVSAGDDSRNRFAAPPVMGTPAEAPRERSLCDESEDIAPVRPPAPDLFGLAAIPAGNRIIPAKWAKARDSSLAGHSGAWEELLAQVPSFGASSRLAMVNSWVNWHVRFEEDSGDDWADAVTTLKRGAGDCEDMAIAKMALLKDLGVAEDQMFLILLRERLRPVDHAVLAVRQDGQFHILDSRTDQVLPSEMITDYLPLRSYSGPFAWIYGYRPVAQMHL